MGFDLRTRLGGASTERYFDRLTRSRQRRVEAKLQKICLDPYDLRESLALAGRADGLRRARVGDRRILFYVKEEVHIVDVTEIGPRGEVYKGR